MKKFLASIILIVLCQGYSYGQKKYEMVVKTTDGKELTIKAEDLVRTYFRKIEEEPPANAGLCPDNHHPHMIDLGLPSGTKWACCNVGASVPEEFGLYLSWGESASKEDYSDKKYLHKNGNEYIDIGANITKTQYDAAYVLWGDSWQMPTVDQFNELLEFTQYSWVERNGVYGGLFTSSNGKSVFLPAAGGIWKKEVLGDNLEGYYWTSEIGKSYDYTAWFLSFDFDRAKMFHIEGHRFVGRSVRPVHVNSEN